MSTPRSLSDRKTYADYSRLLSRDFAASRSRLWKLIRFRLHDAIQRRIDVDDVLQDVYVAASKRYEAYLASDYPTPFLWLRDVAIQTLHNVHRFHLGTQMRDVHCESQLQSAALGSTPHPIERLAASFTTPSQAAIRNELIAVVTNALDQLSETDREVIQLRQFEELANEEVAHVLRVTPQAASIRYVRALGRLRVFVERGTQRN